MKQIPTEATSRFSRKTESPPHEILFSASLHHAQQQLERPHAPVCLLFLHYIELQLLVGAARRAKPTAGKKRDREYIDIYICCTACVTRRRIQKRKKPLPYQSQGPSAGCSAVAAAGAAGAAAVSFSCNKSRSCCALNLFFIRAHRQGDARGKPRTALRHPAP